MLRVFGSFHAKRDSRPIRRLYERQAGEDRNRRPLPFIGGYHVNHCTGREHGKYHYGR